MFALKTNLRVLFIALLVQSPEPDISTVQHYNHSIPNARDALAPLLFALPIWKNSTLKDLCHTPSLGLVSISGEKLHTGAGQFCESQAHLQHSFTTQLFLYDYSTDTWDMTSEFEELISIFLFNFK